MFVDLVIETLTVGGRGLGRHAGKAVFVPLTAPDDRIRGRIVREHRHYAEAELVELLEPAASRRAPPCPVFGRCGGCQWQHLAYPHQAHWKERLFSDTVTRAGVVAHELLRPLVTAPGEWGYRSRMQFKCRQTEHGLVAGFYRHGSHYVVDVAACLLAAPPIRDVFAALREALPGSPCPDAIPQIDISCGEDARVAVLCHVLPEAAEAVRRWLAGIAAEIGCAACLQIGRKETLEVVVGDPSLHYAVADPPLELRLGPGCFSQVNPEQNRRLVAEVIAAAQLGGGERVLDLFCGIGNFSLPLAGRAGAVVGVEGYAPAIADARQNALRLGLDNTRFLAEPADGAVTRLSGDAPFDLVVVDPPRTGALGVMRELVNHRPGRIIYVSCDPATLARDLKPLVHNGYRVAFSQPIDMFPQTWHVESVTLLQRVG